MTRLLSPSRAPFAMWISVLALLTAIAPLATDMYLPAFPTIAADLGTTASGVQLTITAFLLGLALGQLAIGPLSDGWGRRRLLIGGTAVCAVASIAVALSPSIEFAIVARFVQGFGGAAGIVLSRAMIVDRTSGARTAMLFGLLQAIGGVAPVLAPLLGSGLVAVIGWRGIFLVIAGLAVLMLVGILIAVPESLTPELRRGGGLRRTVKDIGVVLRRPRYLGFALAYALSFSAMFAYISGSPFVLQEVLHLSTVEFALVFGVNAIGQVIISLLAARAARWIAPLRQLIFGVGLLLVVTVALLVVVLAGAPTVPVLILLFLTTCSLGFILGNGAALALTSSTDLAGTASALLGALQFGLSAAVSPLVGSSATRMAATMVVSAALAAAALLIVRIRTSEPVPTRTADAVPVG